MTRPAVHVHHLLLLGLVLVPSRAAGDSEIQPAPRYLELGARAGPRIVDCPVSCDSLPPGFGVGGFLGVRMHHHFAAGFSAGHDRFFHAEEQHPLRGVTFIGPFVRGYVARHSTFDPYLEIAGLAASPVGPCPGGHQSMGGFGYRATLGSDWRIGPGMKLGVAASYLRTRFGCVVDGADDARVEVAHPPPTLGGFGIDLVVTAVPF